MKEKKFNHGLKDVQDCTEYLRNKQIKLVTRDVNPGNPAYPLIRGQKKDLPKKV